MQRYIIKEKQPKIYRQNSTMEVKYKWLLDKESEELFIDCSLWGENEPVNPKR